MRLIRWFQRLTACWKLARQIQRGELVAITPERLVSRAVAVPPPVLTIPPVPAPVEPITMTTAAEAAPDAWPAIIPGAPFQVRAARPGQEPRIIASGYEEAMKAYWRQRASVPGGSLELYDVKLNLVRGSK